MQLMRASSVPVQSTLVIAMGPAPRPKKALSNDAATANVNQRELLSVILRMDNNSIQQKQTKHKVLYAVGDRTDARYMYNADLSAGDEQVWC